MVFLLEVVAVLVTFGGTVGWLVHRKRTGTAAGSTSIWRRPIRPLEIGIAALVCAGCVAANALAVAHLEPLSLQNLGPFAVVFHERQPSPFLLATALFLLLLASFVPGLGRAAIIFFVGAAAANVMSPLFWDGAVPDYLVLTRVDVVANLSDAVMIVTALVAAVSIVHLGWRGSQQPPR